VAALLLLLLPLLVVADAEVEVDAAGAAVHDFSVSIFRSTQASNFLPE